MGRGLGDRAREMLVWLLIRGDRDLEAARGDRRKLKALAKWGPEYSPDRYRQDGHPDASSDKQCQTRKGLVGRGLIIPYPATGHVRRLYLTDKGRQLATFLRDHDGCSPDEIDRAVKRSSFHDRTRLRMTKAAQLHTDLTPDDDRWLWDQRARHSSQVEQRERNCRFYIESLPPELMEAEVERITREGWDESHFRPFEPQLLEFTDGGTVPFPSPRGHEVEVSDKALN